MMTTFWRAGEIVVLEMRSGKTWPGDFFHSNFRVSLPSACGCGRGYGLLFRNVRLEHVLGLFEWMVLYMSL